MKKIFLLICSFVFLVSSFLTPIKALEGTFNGKDYPVIYLDPYAIMPLDFDYEGFTCSTWVRPFSGSYESTGGWTEFNQYLSLNLNTTYEIALDISFPVTIKQGDKIYFSTGFDYNNNLIPIEFKWFQAIYKNFNTGIVYNYWNAGGDTVFTKQSGYNKYTAGNVGWINSNYEGYEMTGLSLRFKFKTPTSWVSSTQPLFDPTFIRVESSGSGLLNQDIIDSGKETANNTRGILGYISGIFDILGQIGKSCADAFADLFAGTGTLISHVSTNLINGFDGLPLGIQAALSSLFGGLSAPIRDILENLSGKSDDHDLKVEQSINNFKDSVNSFKDNMSNSFDNLSNFDNSIIENSDFKKTAVFMSNQFTRLYESHSSISGVVMFSLVIGLALCVVGISTRR